MGERRRAALRDGQHAWAKETIAPVPFCEPGDDTVAYCAHEPAGCQSPPEGDSARLNSYLDYIIMGDVVTTNLYIALLA